MPNVSAISRLVQFIEEQNLRPMRPWRIRRYGRAEHHRNQFWTRLKRNVRSILSLVSGGCIVEMLKSILSIKEKSQLSEDLKEIRALKNLSTCYKETNLKKRRFLATALKKSHMNRSNARKLGFNISQKLWKNCDNGVERNKGGGPTISLALIEAVQNYLFENSNPASNRLTINKNKYDSEYYNTEMPARYLEKNPTDLYREFPLRQHISKTTFFKYISISSLYKKPIRFTDLCDYCELGTSLKRSIVERLGRLDYVSQEAMSIESISTFLNTKKAEILTNAGRRGQIQNQINQIDLVYEDLQSYKAILFHKNIAKVQRASYNNNRTQVEQLRNKIMIDVDFKQKIVIGYGPRQINSEYFDKRKRQRTCLGFGIYYVDQDEIKCINFDIVASDDCQEGRAVVRGFRLLRMQPFFRQIDTKEYIVWFDCGKHFRNNLVAGYLFRELAEERILVSKYVHSASLQKKLRNSEDVVNAIVDGQRLANQNRIFEGQRRKMPKRNQNQTTYAIALDFSKLLAYKNQFPHYKSVTIKNIESFYNFRTVQKQNSSSRQFKVKLVTSVLSNREETIEFLNANDDQDVTPIYNIEIEDQLDEEPLALKTLQKKEDRLRFLFSKLSKIIQTNNPQVNREQLDFFSTNLSSNVVNQNQVVALPEYCRGIQIGQKPPCNACNAPCELCVRKLLRGEYTQSLVLLELSQHKHPTSRKIPQSAANNAEMNQRTTVEANYELANHYFYSHGISRPI